MPANHHSPSTGNSSLVDQLATSWPVSHWQDTRILLALSGGADSTALMVAMRELAPDSRLIEAAHFNHGWRGAESDGDQRFVERLCEEKNIRLHVGTSQREIASEEQPAFGSEEYARDERYSFLAAKAYEVGARYVVTAHTMDDRVETLLHNLFRGTGLAGMHSLKPFRPFDTELVLARPMLTVSRKDIETFLRDAGCPYRRDASNADTRFRRNFLRAEILPKLREQYGDHLDERILTFSEITREADEELSRQAEEFSSACRIQTEESIRRGELPSDTKRFIAFPLTRALQTGWPVLHHWLTSEWKDRQWPMRQLSRQHWQMIRDACTASSDSANAKAARSLDRWQVLGQLPGALSLTLGREWLIISEANVMLP